MNQAIMNAMDAISGSQAVAYVTLGDGNRYCFMQLHNFESNMAVNVTEVPIFRKTGKGNKPNGWTGTWKGTAYYNQSVIRKMLLEYKNTGYMAPFDIQVSNEDTASAVGRQTIILKQCLVKGGTLAKFDANSNSWKRILKARLTISEMPETFTMLNGMEM